MRKVILPIITIILAGLTVLASVTFINRWGLPYNSEGNYFDESSAVVYHEQSVLVYGTAATVLLLLTVLPGYMTAKKFRATT